MGRVQSGGPQPVFICFYLFIFSYFIFKDEDKTDALALIPSQGKSIKKDLKSVGFVLLQP